MVGGNVFGETEETAAEEDEADEGLDIAKEEDGLEEMGLAVMSTRTLGRAGVWRLERLTFARDS